MSSNWNPDRNAVDGDRKLLIFFLSFLASSLLLVSRVVTEYGAAVFFSMIFLIVLLGIIFLIFNHVPERWRFRERKLLQSRLRTLAVAGLGFGLGALVYHNRAWFIWLWGKFRLIDRHDEWMLFSLFLIGVILGFFVVRNWSKDQASFLTSLTSVFGAAFVSTLLGQLTTQSGSVLTPQNAFFYYALGFSLSGALNLISFALLIGNYSRTQSSRSRSIIDFLYGSDKAQAIDGYFLKNFESDPNYAKAKLVAALSAYRDLIRIEFARRMNDRKDSSVQVEIDSPPSPCAGDDPPPFDYFELLAIRSTLTGNSPTSPPAADKSSYEIIFRKLRQKQQNVQGDLITPEMFRVHVSMRWQDNIEYVVTAGQYLKAFPYYGSVAGMALQVRKTIVMNRDRYKKFRTGDFLEGKTPNQVDQPRGLYELDYLSYIIVPMASGFGRPEEQPLGLLHLDTKLFACRQNTLPEGACRMPHAASGEELYRIFDEAEDEKTLRERLEKRLDEFELYACNLYTQNDPLVEDLVKMKEVIIPLLELYKKCRTGATNQATTTTTTTTAA